MSYDTYMTTPPADEACEQQVKGALHLDTLPGRKVDWDIEYTGVVHVGSCGYPLFTVIDIESVTCRDGNDAMDDFDALPAWMLVKIEKALEDDAEEKA